MILFINRIVNICFFITVIWSSNILAMESDRWRPYNTATDDFVSETTESNEDHREIINPTTIINSSPKINLVQKNIQPSDSSSEDDYEKRNYDYYNEVTSNLQETEIEFEEMKKTKFSLYVKKHLKGQNFTIDNLTYEQKINTLNSTIEDKIEKNKLKLDTMINELYSKKAISDQTKQQNNNSINNKINNSDVISKSFRDDLRNLGEILGNYHRDLVAIGLGYYAHKFFRLYSDYCTPEKDDSLEVWLSKNKIFTTNLRCFLLQFESQEFSRYKTEIQKKSHNTLSKYFQVSCDHLIYLYKNRSGFTVTLSKTGIRESQTKKSLEEFTNNYLLDFNFIKNIKHIEKKFLERKVSSFKELDAIDADFEKKGTIKTLVGESATTAANMGSALLTQGTNLASQGLSHGVTSLYNYYYSPTTQEQQIAEEKKEGEPTKKGWFGW